MHQKSLGVLLILQSCWRTSRIDQKEKGTSPQLQLWKKKKCISSSRRKKYGVRWGRKGEAPKEAPNVEKHFPTFASQEFKFAIVATGSDVVRVSCFDIARFSWHKEL